MATSEGSDLGGGGLADQLPRIVGVVRGGMHAFAVVTRWRPGGRARVAIGAVVSLAADVWLTGELRRGRVPRVGTWLSLDVADTALWASTATGGLDLQAPMVGNSWTHAAVRGYQASVGLDAQPVLAGTRPFPPASRRQAIVAAAETGAVWTLPFVAGTAVLRRRGVAAPLHQLRWPVLGTVTGVVAGRIRAGQHRRAERLWRRRADRGALLHERAARFAIVTGVEEVHDLPRVLAILGEHSELCRFASLDSRDRPRRLVEGTALGQPLGRALPYHPVDPPEARMLWLTPDQTDAMVTAIGAVEERSSSDLEEPIVFRDRTATSLRFSYLGEEIVLTTRPNLDDIVFDHVATGLVGSAIVKWTIARRCGVPVPIGVVAGLLDLAAAAVTVRGELTGRRRVEVVLGLGLVSSALWLVPVRLRATVEVDDEGRPVFAGTQAMSILGPLGHYWSHTPPAVRGAALAIGALWADAVRARRTPTARRDVAGELIVSLQYLLATLRWADRADAERVRLADRLQREYDDVVTARERAVRRIELDRYAELQQLGRRELDRLIAEGALDDAVREHVSADLDAIAAFVAEARRHEAGVLA